MKRTKIFIALTFIALAVAGCKQSGKNASANEEQAGQTTEQATETGSKNTGYLIVTDSRQHCDVDFSDTHRFGYVIADKGLFVDFQDMGGMKGGRQYSVSVARWQTDGDNVSIESFKKGVGRPGKFEFSDVPKGYPMLAMTLAPTPDCEQQTYASVKHNLGKTVFHFCKSDSVARVAEEIINSPGYEALKQFIEDYTPDEQTTAAPSSQTAETKQGDGDFEAFFKKFASDLKFQQQHIKFPLQGSDDDNEFTYSSASEIGGSVVWADEWPEAKLKTSVSGNTAKAEYWNSVSGEMNLQYEFKKVGGEWKLVSFYSQSK